MAGPLRSGNLAQAAIFHDNQSVVPRARRKSRPRKRADSGKLRIGDNWNAITIIALSQNNPLKAIAEFVENSIDARAGNITIVRGKEHEQMYLKVVDDGEGIPLAEDGTPNFRFVATHVCDSIKRRLRSEGVQGIQGEFGIGLLSFWTVGERLVLASAGADGRAYQMEMKKGEPGYTISPRRSLFSHPGTELVIHPLLPGIRQINGERIQHYLASELRDRIRKSGVKIQIKDRHARKELEVVPRQFTGRLLHQFNALPTQRGELYLELYLNAYAPENTVSLFRSGTRVLPSLAALDFFAREPWTSGYLQGMIDAAFLQLTPGTRDGIVQDESFALFCQALAQPEASLKEIIELEKKADEEEASRNILKAVQRALKEAFLALPREDYDWFEIETESRKPSGKAADKPLFPDDQPPAEERAAEGQKMPLAAPPQPPAAGMAEESKAFYEYPGPLHQAVISPASCILKVRAERSLRCIARDRARRLIEENLQIRWSVKEGEGKLSGSEGEMVTFSAPEEPGLAVVQAVVTQGEIACRAESIITVTESLLEKEESGRDQGKGIPGYTFVRAPGELWRSRYDEKNNLIVINNGHSDYLYASQKKARKLKYICRLFAKELVLKNFLGFDSGQLLERMIELSLYTEEHLR